VDNEHTNVGGSSRTTTSHVEVIVKVPSLTLTRIGTDVPATLQGGV
jgi:hypothetical protein